MGGTGVDGKDDRGAVKKGFDIIYEARELDLPQNQRDGLSQFRESGDDTKKRIAESGERLKKDVLVSIKKGYWPAASNELRRQMGTMRFDLKNLAETKEGAAKKAAVEAKNTFISDVEKLDLAIVNKNQKLALERYEKSIASLDTVLKVMA